MSVPARPAKGLPYAATIGRVDLRGPTPVRAGTYPFDVAQDTVSAWHSHDIDQLEYATRGVVEVETETARYLLPPHQAVWIPAGLPHCTTLRQVSSIAVFFEPGMVRGAGDRARVLPAAPVLREMILYGARWRIDRAAGDTTADIYFEALAALVHEWLDHEVPLCLPTAKSPMVAAIMEHTNAHLADVTASEVAKAAGLSERSLRRLFFAETGMTWRQYRLESRLLRSMAVLAEPGPNILEVSTLVGFRSVSAFTRAFRSYTGEAPSNYRRRVTNPDD